MRTDPTNDRRYARVGRDAASGEAEVQRVRTSGRLENHIAVLGVIREPLDRLHIAGIARFRIRDRVEALPGPRSLPIDPRARRDDRVTDPREEGDRHPSGEQGAAPPTPFRQLPKMDQRKCARDAEERPRLVVDLEKCIHPSVEEVLDVDELGDDDERKSGGEERRRDSSETRQLLAMPSDHPDRRSQRRAGKDEDRRGQRDRHDCDERADTIAPRGIRAPSPAGSSTRAISTPRKMSAITQGKPKTVRNSAVDVRSPP